MDYWPILLILALFKAISTLLKKKDEPNRTPTRTDNRGAAPLAQRPVKDAHPPAPATPRPPARTFDWEAELRRLLEGEPEPPPPPARPPAPGVVVPPVLPQSAAPPTPPKPTPLPAPAAPRPPTIVRRPAKATPTAVPVESRALLAEADQSYATARDLPQKVAEHLQQVGELRPTPPAQREHLAPAATVAALALLRRPDTVRQAFIASLVFGPPKALETQSSPGFPA